MSHNKVIHIIPNKLTMMEIEEPRSCRPSTSTTPTICQVCNSRGFSMGMGSCFYLMTLGNNVTACWEFAQSLTSLFATNFDSGCGIMTMSCKWIFFSIFSNFLLIVEICCQKANLSFSVVLCYLIIGGKCWQQYIVVKYTRPE